MRWGALTRALDAAAARAVSTWCTSTRRSSRTTPGVRFARRAGMPVVATYHTFFEEYLHHYVPVLPRALGRVLARQLHALAVRAAVQALIAPSEPMRAAAARVRRRRTPIHVMPTGLPADRLRCRRRRALSRAASASPPDRPLLLYVGRVAHEKNIDFLVQVFVALRRSRSRCACWSSPGEGPARERLRALVARLGLERARALRRLPGSRQRAGSTAMRPPTCSCSPRAPRRRAWCCSRRMAQGAPVVSTARARHALDPEAGLRCAASCRRSRTRSPQRGRAMSCEIRRCAAQLASAGAQLRAELVVGARWRGGWPSSIAISPRAPRSGAAAARRCSARRQPSSSTARQRCCALRFCATLSATA